MAEICFSRCSIQCRTRCKIITTSNSSSGLQYLSCSHALQCSVHNIAVLPNHSAPQYSDTMKFSSSLLPNTRPPPITASTSPHSRILAHHTRKPRTRRSRPNRLSSFPVSPVNYHASAITRGAATKAEDGPLSSRGAITGAGCGRARGAAPGIRPKVRFGVQLPAMTDDPLVACQRAAPMTAAVAQRPSQRFSACGAALSRSRPALSVCATFEGREGGIRETGDMPAVSCVWDVLGLFVWLPIRCVCLCVRSVCHWMWEGSWWHVSVGMDCFWISIYLCFDVSEDNENCRTKANRFYEQTLTQTPFLWGIYATVQDFTISQTRKWKTIEYTKNA